MDYSKGARKGAVSSAHILKSTLVCESVGARRGESREEVTSGMVKRQEVGTGK